MKFVVINKCLHARISPWLQLPLLSLALVLQLFIGAGSAAAGYQPDLMVRLSSESDASYVGRGVYEAIASTQSKTQPAFQGSGALFRVLLRNAGDRPDRIVLKGTGSGSGVSVRYLDEGGADRSAALSGEGFSATLAPGETYWLSVLVAPDSITPGASYRVSVSASSASDPARLDQVKTETVSCASSAAVIVSAPPDGAGQIGSVVTYPYTVTNVGSSVNTFVLAADTGKGWQGTVVGATGAATSSTGPLAPGASYEFQLQVSIPHSSSNGARADSYLTVTGDRASGADSVTTTALAATISVAENVRNLTQGGTFDSTSTTAFPGDILQYRMSITNSGSVSASGVTIEAPLPQNALLVPGSLWVGTSSGGEGTACPASECGAVRDSGGAITALLGQGATDSTGGILAPGKTLYVYFRVQVE